jgi:hypothetical protein
VFADSVLQKELAPKINLSLRNVAGNTLLHTAVRAGSIIVALLVDTLKVFVLFLSFFEA